MRLLDYVTVLLQGLANGAAHTFEVRAVNSAGAGVPAAVSAAPTPAVCALDFGERREVWSDTMTVGLRFPGADGQGGTIAGYIGIRSQGSFAGGNELSVAGAPYTVSTMITSVPNSGDRAPVEMLFSDTFPAAVRAALRFHWCSESSVLVRSNERYRTSNRNVDWSLYPTREIALSLPPNNAATGAPAIVSDITGMAHVGRTLTASAGTVADDDGVPSALTYQWYRVDRNNVEREISRAASAAYTPTAADLGHTLKVKALFQDDLGGVEERESVETPTVEQPTLTIADESATEGSALSFAVTLSPATDRQVTVNWAASTAGANTASTNDLSGTTSGSLTFAANETGKTIAVSTVQDEVYEANETFTVTLSGLANAVLGTDRAATGTIVNDEGVADGDAGAGRRHDPGVGRPGPAGKPAPDHGDADPGHRNRRGCESQIDR